MLAGSGDLIYCLGHQESYDAGLSQGLHKKKRGRDGERYGGGAVWQTQEAAQQVADDWPGYAVYGVRARWGVDTEPSKMGDYHRLLVDSEIVQLEEE